LDGKEEKECIPEPMIAQPEDIRYLNQAVTF